ncbi:MAG: glycosyltransferase family 39 protein [Chitinophagales bacterium]|nr:glycosyltransferase family 39 protein [Chitinophagales bacterium]
MAGTSNSRDKQRWKYSAVIAIISALLFIPFLGGVHLFDWDEINFAEISREMLVTGEFSRVSIDFFPFYEKPPLFFWLQAASMKILGINEFAARFPNAICGIISLIFLYNIGRKLHDHRFGILWSLVYAGSVLPFLYFKSGIIDPVFNLFIFSSIYFFLKFKWERHFRFLITSALLIGLAILTKGPVAILIVSLCIIVFWIFNRFKFPIHLRQLLLFAGVSLVIPGIWFAYESMVYGPSFVQEFIAYQWRLFSTPDAGHSGFPGFHLVVLLIGCFPASIFAIKAFRKLPGEENLDQAEFRQWMKYLFWVVLILFSIVESKIIHYTSLCYFPLTYLAALVLYKLIIGELDFSRWLKAGLIGIASLFIVIPMLATYLAIHPEFLISMVDQDEFALNSLQADVNWTGLEVIPALFLLTLLIAVLLQFKKNRYQAIKILFGGMAVYILFSLFFFIKRVEGYSQRAAVEFAEKKAAEDSYVINAGYKSYVPLFYSPRTAQFYPSFESRKEKMEWMLWGEIDKPVYIITRIDKLEEVLSWTGAKEIARKNGFVFLKRNDGN